MPAAERVMRVAPEAVWAVLADGGAYADWVVGASRVRAVDDAFPAPGTCFHHTFGTWPLLVRDRTEVVACEPPRRLVLVAHAGPLGAARVAVDVAPHPRGARVRLHEGAADLAGRLTLNPLTDPLTRLRNAVALRRLEALASR